jgi:hypothetical protein
MARIARVVVPTCPAMSPSAAIGASRCFFEADDYRLYRRLVARQRGAPAQQSGPIA